MIIKTSELETVCGITSILPENEFPEIAFAGKSNVGKSSLINSLLNRKNLARTSSQPGKTQTINFYKVNSEFYFVDLPGYGYAAVSQEIKAKWGKMIERYLKKSNQLRMIFLLIDIRHDPSANDKQMFDWIASNGFTPVIIATKLDKIKRSEQAKKLKAVRTGLGAEKCTVIPFSAVSKQGREDILNLIESVVFPQEDDSESVNNDSIENDNSANNK
ncbi:MAG: ribosome biogenesis GTP-binding protein YihA/YsxC [Eubacterium sp.]|nr:ribosome biogenesis GTP-binding protein YihA/YsxC [Eubacterium sp.]